MSGEWRPVCGYTFGPRAAAIVCRQLGFVGGVAQHEATNTFGSAPPDTTVNGVGLWGDDSYTPDFPTLLYENRWGPSGCSWDGMSAVTCFNSTGEGSHCLGKHPWRGCRVPSTHTPLALLPHTWYQAGSCLSGLCSLLPLAAHTLAGCPPG